MLAGLAWLFRRAACYTITSKRVLFQFGVALPMTMNIPLGKIANAALKTYRDGSGDIPLTAVRTTSACRICCCGRMSGRGGCARRSRCCVRFRMRRSPRQLAEALAATGSGGARAARRPIGPVRMHRRIAVDRGSLKRRSS